jgi:sulfofructose kinase
MIVFCGYANLDVVGRVPRFPRPDERLHASAVEHLPGGMAANAAVAAARAGAQVAFAGVVGADPLSDRFLAELSADGVDPTWSDRSAFLSTAIVLVDALGRRSVISEDDALGAAHVSAVADRLAGAGAGRSLLYLDGYRAVEVGTAVRPQVTVAVDLDGCDDRHIALDAVRHAGHVVVGRRRLEGLFDVPEERWAALAASSGTAVVVTDGARGWTLCAPDGSTTSGPAPAVTVVDDTGAGDCFAGTYLAGVEAGLPLATAATRAGIAASLSCTVLGARGAPSPHVVDAVLSPPITATPGSTS